MKKTVYISGMHCASCEILIRKLFSEYAWVELISITPHGKAEIIYDDENILPWLGTAIKKLGYTLQLSKDWKKNRKEIAILIIFGAVVWRFFTSMDFSSLTTLVPQQGEGYSLRWIFVLWMVASVSTCLALVGTFVLMWWSLQGECKENFRKALRHQIQFRGGRIFGFALGGALLGSLGGAFIFSPQVNWRINIIIACLMILIGRNMIGWFRLGWQEHHTIKSLKATFIAKLHKLSLTRRWGPVVGALTFFLPCGFTQLAQLIAIQSSSPIQGMLIMVVFVLGTLPMLLFLGMTGNRLHSGHLGIRYKMLGVFIVVVSVFLITQSLRLLGISF